MKKKNKQKKACKMKKNYPINMIFPGAHLQMVNNQIKIFRNIHASMSTDRGQADGQGKTNLRLRKV